MEYNEKLKLALQFLLETNARGESFDYYNEKAEYNKYNGFGLGDVAVPKCSIELQMFKLYTKCQ